MKGRTLKVFESFVQIGDKLFCFQLIKNIKLKKLFNFVNQFLLFSFYNRCIFSLFYLFKNYFLFYFNSLFHSDTTRKESERQRKKNIQSNEENNRQIIGIPLSIFFFSTHQGDSRKMCLLFLKPDCTMILSAIARLSQCTKNVAIEETTAVTVKVKKKMINQKKKTAERGRNTEANIIFFSNTDFSSLCLLITLK